MDLLVLMTVLAVGRKRIAWFLTFEAKQSVVLLLALGCFSD